MKKEEAGKVGKGMEEKERKEGRRKKRGKKNYTKTTGNKHHEIWERNGNRYLKHSKSR